MAKLKYPVVLLAIAGCGAGDPYEVKETWSASFSGFATGVHAGRSIDTNGDGAVDSQDAMQFWVPTVRDEVIGIDHTGATFAQLPYRGLAIGDLDPAADGMEVLLVGDDNAIALHDENGEIWRVIGESGSRTVSSPISRETVVPKRW